MRSLEGRRACRRYAVLRDPKDRGSCCLGGSFYFKTACASTAPSAKSNKAAAPNSKRSQEQIQMITAVIGRATPKAPAIVNSNADSKFALARASYPDMPLLHRSPGPRAGRWLLMVKERLMARWCSTRNDPIRGHGVAYRHFTSTIVGSREWVNLR